MKHILRITFLFLTVVFLTGKSAVPAYAGNYFRSGRVLDLRGPSGPSGDFTARFNEASLASGHPIFLVIVSEEQLAGPHYVDEVLTALMRGEYGSEYGIPDWMPEDVVVIGIAPDVTSGSPAYEYSAPSVAANGDYDTLGETPSASGDGMVDYAIALELTNSTTADYWEEPILQAVGDLGDAADSIGIGQFQAPQQQLPAETIPNQNQPTQVPQPADNSWVGAVFITIILALLITALVIGVLVLISRAMKAQSSLRKAKNRAMELYAELTRIRSGWQNNHDALAQRVIGLQSVLAKGFIEVLQDSLSNAHKLVTDATEDANTLADPATQIMDEDEYLRAAQRIERVLTPHRRAEAILAQVKADIEKMHEIITQAAAALEATENGITLALEVVEQMKVQAQLPCKSARTMIKEAQSKLDDARKAIETRNYETGLQFASQARDTARHAIESARDEPVRVKSLAEECVEDERLAKEVLAHIENGVAAIIRMSQSFAKVNWADVEDNPDEARKLIARVDKALPKIALMIQNGDLDEADNALDPVHEGIQKAGWMIETVIKLEEELQSAAQDLARSIAEADRSIKDGLTYVAREDEEIPEAVEETLERLAEQLEQLITSLGEGNTIDYVRVRAAVKEIDRKADAALTSAQTAVEQMDRARRLAQTEMTTTGKAIAAADTFIDDNDSDVDRTARELLRQAIAKQEKAAQAFKAGDDCEDREEDAQLSYYKSAQELADKAEKQALEALESARGDVKEAKKKRQRYTSSSSDDGGDDTNVIVFNNNVGNTSVHNSPRRDTGSDWKPQTSTWKPTATRISHTPSVAPSASRISHTPARVAPTATRISRK